MYLFVVQVTSILKLEPSKISLISILLLLYSQYFFFFAKSAQPVSYTISYQKLILIFIIFKCLHILLLLLPKSPQRRIGRAGNQDQNLNSWSPGPPEFTPLTDFFLWSYVKYKAFLPPMPATTARTLCIIFKTPCTLNRRLLITKNPKHSLKST